MCFPTKCGLILLAVLLAGSAGAQVFRVQGGTSTLLNAEGGSVEFKAPNYEGSAGLGFFDGHFRYGAETRYRFQGYTMLAGDESVPFTLPTDVFDAASHYFSARGLGATRKDADGSFYAFAGTTSNWLGTGFFHAATSADPVAMLFYERKVNERLRFFSRNILSRRQTFLQGLEYQPKPFAEGIGCHRHRCQPEIFRRCHRRGNPETRLQSELRDHRRSVPAGHRDQPDDL